MKEEIVTGRKSFIIGRLEIWAAHNKEEETPPQVSRVSYDWRPKRKRFYGANKLEFLCHQELDNFLFCYHKRR